VQKEAGVVAPEKVGQHGLGLALTALDVDRLEDGDGVFEQELGVIAAAQHTRGSVIVVIVIAVVVVGIGVRVGRKEQENLQLAADPEAGAREEVRSGGELGRGGQGPVAGDAV
jgi:hypothetical protein